MLTVYSSSVGKVRSPVTGAGWRRLNTVYSKDGSTFELTTTAPLKKGPDIESYDWLRTSLFIYLFIFYELLFIVCEFVFGYCNFCPIALCDVTVTLKLQQEVCFSSNLLSFFTFMGFGCMRMHPFDLVKKKKKWNLMLSINLFIHNSDWAEARSWLHGSRLLHSNCTVWKIKGGVCHLSWCLMSVC